MFAGTSAKAELPPRSLARHFPPSVVEPTATQTAARFSLRAKGYGDLVEALALAGARVARSHVANERLA